MQLVQRLRDQDPSIAPALAWIDDQLARQGTTADAVVRDEHQRQVAGSITVRNIITSMRLISDVDWTELFERFSLVDEVFEAGSRFAGDGFPDPQSLSQRRRGSRPRLANSPNWRSPTRPWQTARRALGANAEAATPACRSRLLSDRRRARRASRRRSVSGRLRRPGRDGPYRALGIGGYVGAGAVVAAGLLAVPLSVAALAVVERRWLLLLGMLGLVPAIDLAVALVNHVVTRGFRATLLPALELRGGVPAELRTLVAVPDAADLARGDRGAGRTAGNPLSGEP